MCKTLLIRPLTSSTDVQLDRETDTMNYNTFCPASRWVGGRRRAVDMTGGVYPIGLARDELPIVVTCSLIMHDVDVVGML